MQASEMRRESDYYSHGSIHGDASMKLTKLHDATSETMKPSYDSVLSVICIIRFPSLHNIIQIHSQL